MPPPPAAPPPHARSGRVASKVKKSSCRLLRPRRARLPTRSPTQARIVPPFLRAEFPRGWLAGALRAAIVPVVAIMTEAFTKVVPETVSEDGTLHVGASMAPVGGLTVQVRLTTPVKPFSGTMATVTLPLPPGERARAAPPGIMLKLALPGVIMVCRRDVSDGRALPFQVRLRTP